MLWLVLIAPLLLQEPADVLRRENERLKRKTVELEERVDFLEQAAVEDAQAIQRLRQTVKLLETTTPPASLSSPPAARAGNAPPQLIKSKIEFVDVKHNFVTIGIGKREKVEIGYQFEIYREIPLKGEGSRRDRLGLAVAEKYIGQESMTKLVIQEGNVAEMKVDDLAVAIRKLGDPSASKDDPKQVPEGTGSPQEGIYAITGRTGAGANAGYVINYGSVQGASQTQLVFAYKDGKFRAKLRLDKVEKSYSVAFVVDGTMELPPEQGDQVYVKNPNRSRVGKVSFSDNSGGRLAIDLSEHDGMKPGMRCEVRRLGQKMGTLLITEVLKWCSFAKAEGDLKIDQVLKGDFVEVVEDK